MDIDIRFKQLDLPENIVGYCLKVLESQMSELYHPSLYIFPLTPEGEELYNWVSEYHFDENGKMVWQSIHRYGAYGYNIKFEGEVYNVVLVNND